MKKVMLVISFMLLSVILIGCVEKTTTTTTQTTTSTTTTTSQIPTDNDPVILGVDDVTIEKNSVFVPLQGVTATDVEDGDLTSEVQYSGNVNPNAVGTYTATYTVTDSDGNVTVEERTVTVVFTDTAAPLITGTANKTIYVGESFNPLTGVSATDTVDGSVDVTVEGSVNIWEEGSYTLTYTAEDEAGNDATATRVITVSFGDFVFGDEVNIPAENFTTAAGIMSSPVFSGGIINEAIANFTYIKVVISASATAAGNISVALGSAVPSLETLALTSTVAEYTVYFVLVDELVDAVIAIDTNDLTVENLTVDYAFAEVRDMVAPVLNVPATDAVHPVGRSLEELEAQLLSRATAVDNIDGNITSSIIIEWGTFDINVVGEQVVTYSVTDDGGNETTAERTVIVGNLVDAGVLTDPTFQNLGDGLWNEKSNNGEVDITYNATEGTMNITVIKLGDWLSAAGTYYKESSANLEVDQWYLFTFTVKTAIARQMGFRMGLVTDQANGWIDDFDGRNSISLNINSEYQTFNYYFKLDSLVSSNGSSEFTIELNLGQNTNWNMPGTGAVTTFKDVAMYKVVTEFDPPTYVEHVGANLPTKFTEGDAAPTWADYVSFYDMSNMLLTPTIDASAVNMAVAGSYDVVYTATDSRDNTTTYTLTITVSTSANADVTGPVITPKEGVPTTLDQFTNVTVDLTTLVTAVDAVDGEIAVLPEMVDNGGLNFNVAGVYTVTYTVYDLSGNITVLAVDVTIVDKQGPTINVGDFVINVGDAFDGLQGLTVVDNVDGTIANSSVVITGLDAFTAEGIATTSGSFEITYTVVDALGNSSSKTVTVTVTDIIWDEDSRTPLGTPDEGPTHSTVAFDAVEGAYVISNIDINVDPWDHARWVYYFNAGSELVFGQTYKFEIQVKADVATDIYFRVGATLWVDPWIDNFDGGLTTIAVSTEYITYQVVFTVDKEMVNGNAKFQFMYGYLPTDATNNIYIKYFDLVQEQQPIVEAAKDLTGETTLVGTISNSTIAYDAVEDAYLITNIPAYTYDWMVGRVTNMFDNTVLTFGETYRVKVVAKATTATDLKVRIGTTLAADPWIDNFEGGVNRFGITTEYVTYYVYFTVDKESFVSANSAKMEFDYGFLSDTENTIYIKDLAIEHVYYPLVEGEDYVQVDGFDYADEAALEATWINRINGVNQTAPIALFGLDTLNGGFIFELPATQTGWYLARRYASLSSLGVTDEFKNLAFYVTNNTNKTTMSVWIYWSGSQMAYTVNLPAIGESGWVTINTQSTAGKLPSQVTDLAIGFDNQTWNVCTGSLTIYEFLAVKDVASVQKYPVEIQLPPNEAPVITMSVADKATIAGMTLKAGESVEALLTSLLSMIQINDAEDGVIAATEAMLNIGSLNAAAPLMGSYDITVNFSDSQGQAATPYVIKLSIVSVLNDFEAYADDAAFKAGFSFVGFRVSGSSWLPANGQLVTLGEDNVLQSNYGTGTNGIRINVTKAQLQALGAEYVGIYVKTSAELAGTISFQAFSYDSSFQQLTTYGTIGYADEGTYVYVAVSSLLDTTTSVSFMINVSSGNTGVLTLDNIVIK
jgi:hypothetical protein